MSLFSKLIQLHSNEHHRLEDYHTEIVAHVLASDSELMLRWLQQLGITDLHEADEIAVSTQQAFDPIEGFHHSGSKPDMTIRARKGSRIEIVFVESKIGSEEGQGQGNRILITETAFKSVLFYPPLKEAWDALQSLPRKPWLSLLVPHRSAGPAHPGSFPA